MKTLGKWQKVLAAIALAVSCVLGAATGKVSAYVDDAGVLNHFNADNSMYMWDYLNQNGYRYYPNDSAAMWGEDAYINKDNSIFISISNGKAGNYGLIKSGQLFRMVFLKPGPATDKGIQVGDSLQKLVNTYGAIYPIYKRKDIYMHDPETGFHDYDKTRNHFEEVGTREIEFFVVSYPQIVDEDLAKRLDFYIDPNREKIIAIKYTGKQYRSNIYDKDNWSYLYRAGLWRFTI